MGRDKILDLWTVRLNHPEKFLLFRMMNNDRLTLSKYFDEVVASLTESRVTIPPLPSEPFPLDGARREVSILLEGKEIMTTYLREHLNLSAEDRLLVHEKINEIFHGLLRANSESACDLCRWALDEKLSI